MKNVVPVELPDKPSFKATEVCEIVQIPAYVLRTWENEFKDLGVSKTGGAARTYRRRDVELALRIKELVFSEHLTLAGVRRRLEQEHLLAPPVEEAVPDIEEASGVDLIAAPVKATLHQVRAELRELLAQLGSTGRDRSDEPAISSPSSSVADASAPPAPQSQTLPGFDGSMEPAGADETLVAPEVPPEPRASPGAERKSKRRRS